MSLWADWVIENKSKEDSENRMIFPFAGSENQKIPGTVSFGLTSYGYDLRLGYKFRVFDNILSTYGGIIDPKKTDWHKCFTDYDLTGKEDNEILIPANSFALAESLEELCIPRNVLGVCLGKSTYARCGIIVNVTPLEPEWRGKVTIEISNTTPLPAKVYAGEGILQVLFFASETICQRSYADKSGKYQNQSGLTMPRVNQSSTASTVSQTMAKDCRYALSHEDLGVCIDPRPYGGFWAKSPSNGTNKSYAYTFGSLKEASDTSFRLEKELKEKGQKAIIAQTDDEVEERFVTGGSVEIVEVFPTHPEKGATILECINAGIKGWSPE
jgi:dCTP deaminase